jgi:hypothetical protein
LSNHAVGELLAVRMALMPWREERGSTSSPRTVCGESPPRNY